MPLGKNIHYGVMTTKSGKKVRLAFRGGSRKAKTGTIVEAKNLETGQTHGPSEFAADRAKSKKRRRKLAQAFGG